MQQLLGLHGELLGEVQQRIEEIVAGRDRLDGLVDAMLSVTAGLDLDSTLRTIDPNVNIIEVRASRGKHIRAEPVAALYEQGKIAHVGAFPELESQMTQMTIHGYEGGKSPDRLDAMVWAFTELFPDMTERVVVPARVVRRGRAGGWLGS